VIGQLETLPSCGKLDPWSALQLSLTHERPSQLNRMQD
jgi:hypothetical protein